MMKRDDSVCKVLIRKALPSDMEAVLELAGDIFEGSRKFPEA